MPRVDDMKDEIAALDHLPNLDERPTRAGLVPGTMFVARQPREALGVTVTNTAGATATCERTTGAAVEWLETEFPGWTVDVDRTATWQGTLRPLWIARRHGHHPQAELSAAKLHTRLTDYLAREARRNALAN